MWDADFAFERFREHRKLIGDAAHKNEAATRLRAVDTLLFNVLGWDKTFVDPETYCREIGYADYACNDSIGLAMIIEAKRSDTAFVLESGQYSEKPVGFALLAKECPEAEKAMRQALGYAAGLGARLIGITNGHQWMLARTFVQNEPLTERSVVVFESVDAIENRFRLFFDCFGPRGVFENRPLHSLSQKRIAPPPLTLAQRLPTYPAPAHRNFIANELSAVLAAVWEEAKHDEHELHFLQECYVAPDASRSEMSLAAELVAQRLTTDEQAFLSPCDPKNTASIITTDTPEKPIVVIGNVGNGKTTFLKVLRKIQAKEVLRKYIQIDMDFIDRPDTPHEVGPYIYSCIEEQLYSQYGIDVQDNKVVRSALNAELNRFKRSPEAVTFEPASKEYALAELALIQRLRNDRHIFLQKVFANIRGSQQFSVAIFLDNLDRRSPEIQEESYLRASAMARDWSAIVFVCLRPATFYQSKAFGVLDSVAPKVIYITPPSASPLLVKRFRYAVSYAKGEISLERNSRSPLSARFAHELPTVVEFLECLTNSFRKRRELSEMFEAISNGNAREMLRSVYSFITSLHLDTKEILDRYREDGKYTVPPHHALKAILFEDCMHYDPERSPFTNLFDVQNANPAEHFSRICTLVYLQSAPDVHPTYRFVNTKEVVQHLQHLGYSPVHATWTLEYLFVRKCLESRDPVERWSDGVGEVRITSLGKYHIGSLCKTFQYVDAMSVVTPIMDDLVRSTIVDSWGIVDRIKRSRSFIKYLADTAQFIPETSITAFISDVVSSVNSEMDRIESLLIASDS